MPVYVSLSLHVLLVLLHCFFLYVCLFVCLPFSKREKEGMELDRCRAGKDLGGEEGKETVIRI